MIISWNNSDNSLKSNISQIITPFPEKCIYLRIYEDCKLFSQYCLPYSHDHHGRELVQYRCGSEVALPLHTLHYILSMNSTYSNHHVLKIHKKNTRACLELQKSIHVLVWKARKQYTFDSANTEINRGACLKIQISIDVLVWKYRNQKTCLSENTEINRRACLKWQKSIHVLVSNYTYRYTCLSHTNK